MGCLEQQWQPLAHASKQVVAVYIELSFQCRPLLPAPPQAFQKQQLLYLCSLSGFALAPVATALFPHPHSFQQLLISYLSIWKPFSSFLGLPPLAFFPAYLERGLAASTPAISALVAVSVCQELLKMIFVTLPAANGLLAI